MKQESNNIFWVDAVKAICIIVVYFAHAEIYTDYTIMPINNVFRPFYVNAFFFVSGYLLFRRQWSESMLKQTLKEWLKPYGGGQILISNILFRLAIPSILFAFVNFFPKKILRGEGISVTELLMDTIGGCSLWFTCSLTLVQILVFVMLLSRRKAVWMYVGVAIGIAVLGVVLNKNGAVILGSIDFPWFYKRAMLALLYVVCGGVYYQYEATIMKILKRWYVLLALIAFYIVVEYAFPKNALCLTSMGEMNVLGVLVSIVGSLLLIELCRRINENKVLTYIGKNSIVYYFFSGAIPVTLSALLSRFFPVNSLLVMLLVFLTSLMLASIVSYIVGKWMPALLDFRKIRIK